MCSFLVRDKNSTHALLMPKVFIFGPKLFLVTGIVHNKSVENHVMTAEFLFLLNIFYVKKAIFFFN